MKLSQKLAQAMSNQVAAEYYSAYLYLAMSAHCDGEGLKGFANWMFVQAQEEMAHGTHLYQYLLERGSVPVLSEIQAPPQEFAGPDDIFERVLAHEQKVTASINEIATLAMQDNDHAAYAFIMWYVQEQVEEESSAELVLQKLRLMAGNPSMLGTLDTELAARVFVDPFAGTQG